MNSTRSFHQSLKIGRRRFLQLTAGTAALGFSRRAWPFAQSPTNIRKFVINLPGLGPSGANQIGQYLPLATKSTANFAGLSTDVYGLGVKQFGEKMHPDMMKATQFWGYYDLATGDQKYLAGVIVAKRGTPVLLNVTNQLPNKAIIPIDPTIPASATQTVGQLPLNRIATHLHGGFTPWFSDGTPFQWFDPFGLSSAGVRTIRSFGHGRPPRVVRRLRAEPDLRGIYALRRQQGGRRSASHSRTTPIGIRSWLIESRSRTVTASSSRLSKSTVTQYGVPISSCRR